jgi:hydroxymethylglutaryl-CoA reductase (NADPH)
MVSRLKKVSLGIHAGRAGRSLRKIAKELDLERKVSEGSPEEDLSGGVIPRGDDVSALQMRQKLLESQGIDISWLKKEMYPTELVKGNIENYTGTAKIPIGLAGPVLINGQHAKGSFIIPIATTEGTLVASYNRGMKVIRESGGCTTRVWNEGMQRAPVFHFANIGEAAKFSQWVRESREDLSKFTATTSGRVSLKDVEIHNIGRNVYLRFTFNTGDAAGQNMANKAAFVVCKYIEKAYPGKIDGYWLEGNIATDKKYSRLNVLSTRGKRVSAEVEISRETLKKVLRTTPENLLSIYTDGTLGSFYAGSSTNGAHAANALAALFISCGQDVANIAESSAGLVDLRASPSGVYVSVTLPSLIVGTMGGGTGLPTQKECLDILGCKGTGGALKFAEICAATVLAGELSLAGAITSEEWAEAHEKMGRNRE